MTFLAPLEGVDFLEWIPIHCPDEKFCEPPSGSAFPHGVGKDPNCKLQYDQCFCNFNKPNKPTLLTFLTYQTENVEREDTSTPQKLNIPGTL